MKALSYLFAALLLLLVLLFTLPFTSPGTRLLMQLVERTGLVTVEYQAGSLFGDLSLAQFGIEAGAVS